MYNQTITCPHCKKEIKTNPYGDCDHCGRDYLTINEEYKKKINPSDFYLEYINNFLTVAGIAENYGISETHANYLLNKGRNLNI